MVIGVATCANCGRRLYRHGSGAWWHCYTVSVWCEDGKKAMAQKDDPDGWKRV